MGRQDVAFRDAFCPKASVREQNQAQAQALILLVKQASWGMVQLKPQRLRKHISWGQG